MPEPVLVQIRTGKALFHGALAGVIGLIWLGVNLIFWLSAEMETGAVLAGLGITFVFGVIAVHHIGLAVKKPVALKMDAKGISGYYAEPAIWPEIMEIKAFSGSKGRRYLGFAFLNPDTITARQSWDRRLKNWSYDFSYRYQIVVPEKLLSGANVDDLATRAEAFRRAA